MKIGLEPRFKVKSVGEPVVRDSLVGSVWKRYAPSTPEKEEVLCLRMGTLKLHLPPPPLKRVKTRHLVRSAKRV